MLKKILFCILWGINILFWMFIPKDSIVVEITAYTIIFLMFCILVRISNSKINILASLLLVSLLISIAIPAIECASTEITFLRPWFKVFAILFYVLLPFTFWSLKHRKDS